MNREITMHLLNLTTKRYTKWKNKCKTLKNDLLLADIQLDNKWGKWKTRTRNSEQLINNLNQQIFVLQNNIANMATLQDVMSSLSPLIAQIPQYIGQEPPDEYYNKIVQVFAYGGALGVVGFNDGVKAEILKSKMSGKYTPVPAQYPAGTNIDTPARFLAWLRHKYHEETIGSRNASLSRLAQEKFNPTDTPQTYEDRIHLLLLQIPNNNQDALAILWTHLPDELFTRVKITNPADINAFFTAVKDTWLERKPSTFTYNGVNNNSSSK